MELAPEVDMILVVGSQTSANSTRLAMISGDAAGRGELIGSADDIREEWFDDATVERIGVSAGASTPQFLVDAVIDRLVGIGGGQVEVIRLLPEKRKKANSAAGWSSWLTGCTARRRYEFDQDAGRGIPAGSSPPPC